MSAAIGDLGATRALHAARQDRMAQVLVLLPMLAYTLLSKIAIPAGSSQIASFLPIVLMTMPLGMLTGRLELVPENLIFFMVMAAVLTAEQVFGGNPFSISSLGLLLSVHLLYVFRLKRGLVAPDFPLRAFQNITLFLALCGIAQFGLQFVIGVDLAFPLDMKLPTSIILQNFHNMNPLSYGSPIYKSNGLFLAEPSFFSQILAVSLLVELTHFRRFSRILPMLGGMIVSYSGTGLVLLAVATPIMIVQERRYELLLFGAIGAVAAIAGSSLIGLDIFVERASEFGSTESSGFARFVGGFYLFDQYLWPFPLRALFGLGAGSVQSYIDIADYPAWDASWVKLPFEYGLVGAVVYFAFAIFCTMRAPGALAVKIVLLMAFIIGAALIPPIHMMTCSLLVWPWAKWGQASPWRFGLFERGLGERSQSSVSGRRWKKA